MSTLHRDGPVLCALDFSEGSEAALVQAADLAERFHTSLLLLHADPLVHASPSSSDVDLDATLRERMRSFAEAALGSAEAVHVVDPEGVIRHAEYAGDAVVRQAEEAGASLVVVGTHGRRGLGRVLSGSVAEDVVRHAPCDVLVVPNGAARTAPRGDAPILVSVDFSAHTDAALDRAVELARSYGAPLRLLHVIGPSLPLPAFYGDVIGPDLYDVPTLVETSRTHLQSLADGLEVDAETDGGAPHRDRRGRAGGRGGPDRDGDARQHRPRPGPARERDGADAPQSPVPGLRGPRPRGRMMPSSPMAMPDPDRRPPLIPSHIAWPAFIVCLLLLSITMAMATFYAATSDGGARVLEAETEEAL